MKPNKFGQLYFNLIPACILAVGSFVAAGLAEAATAAGRASATVVDSATIIININSPVLSGTIFTVQSFTSSLSSSGPLLRAGANPATFVTNPPSLVASGGVPSAANTVVSVTRQADGSLAVRGGTGLTFAVSQPVGGAVSIEYN